MSKIVEKRFKKIAFLVQPKRGNETSLEVWSFLCTYTNYNVHDYND